MPFTNAKYWRASPIISYTAAVHVVPGLINPHLTLGHPTHEALYR